MRGTVRKRPKRIKNNSSRVRERRRLRFIRGRRSFRTESRFRMRTPQSPFLWGRPVASGFAPAAASSPRFSCLFRCRGMGSGCFFAVGCRLFPFRFRRYCLCPSGCAGACSLFLSVGLFTALPVPGLLPEAGVAGLLRSGGRIRVRIGNATVFFPVVRTGVRTGISAADCGAASGRQPAPLSHRGRSAAPYLSAGMLSARKTDGAAYRPGLSAGRRTIRFAKRVHGTIPKK